MPSSSCGRSVRRRSVFRSCRLAAALAASVLGLAGPPAAPAAGGSFTCSGGTATSPTRIPAHVNGDVTVVGSCILSGSTVTGSVTVKAGGGLYDFGSKIGGSLTATRAAWIDVGRGGVIGGSLIVSGTTGKPKSSRIDGVVTANDLCHVTVGGNIELTGNGPHAPFFIGAPPDCTVAITVEGNVLVHGNAARIAIGGSPDQDDATIHGNQVLGAIDVQGNKGGGTVVGNQTGGSCDLEHNHPAFSGHANRAQSGGQDACNGSG